MVVDTDSSRQINVSQIHNFFSSFNCFITRCDIIITVSYPCSEYEPLKIVKTLIHEVSSSVLNVSELPFVDLHAYKKCPAGNAGHEITFFNNIEKIYADTEPTFHIVPPTYSKLQAYTMKARRQAETQSIRVKWELLIIYPVTGFSAEKVKQKETPVMALQSK